MNTSIRNLMCAAIAVGTLAACSSKPADTTASAGGAPAATAGGSTSASGTYHGVALYPGMTQLTTNDIPGGPDGTLHSGNFRSTDPQEKILAFYRDALTRQFGTVGDMPGGGDAGMVRIASGNGKDQMVTILVHPDESGGQIVGMQVASKD